MRRTAGFELDLEQIISGALRLLKQHGVDALSMRRLATELGVTSAAIYYYFPSKDALVDTIVERLYERVTVATTGPWQDRLRSTAASIGSVFAEFPGALPYLLARTTSTPTGLRISDTALGWLFEEGFTDEEVTHAGTMCLILLVGIGQLGAFPHAGEVRPTSSSEDDLEIGSLSSIVRIAPHLSHPVGRRELDYGLGLVIADLEGRLAARA